MYVSRIAWVSIAVVALEQLRNFFCEITVTTGTASPHLWAAIDALSARHTNHGFVPGPDTNHNRPSFGFPSQYFQQFISF